MSSKVASRVMPAQRRDHDLVADWVAEGIITAEQGDRIRAREGDVLPSATPVSARSVMPRVVEALGYLGGAIVVVATVLIAGQYWTDLGVTARLGLLAAAAVLLLVGGWVIPDRLGHLGGRIRAVLWLASTGVVAGFLGVWGGQQLALHDVDLALLVTGGTAAYAATLFALRPSALQQLAMMCLFAGTASALLANFVDTDSWPGLGFWAVGVLWVLLGQIGVLRPAEMARVMGAVLALFGSMITTSDRADAALVFSLATVVAVVVLAVVLGDLLLLAVGSLGAIQAILMAVSEWFPNSLAAALALLLVGGALVLTAIWIARRGARGRPSSA